MLFKALPFVRRVPVLRGLRMMYSDDKAGSIREAGGAFGQREAAQENQYFKKLEQEQLKKLKSHVDEQIDHHEAELKRHKDAIEKLKKQSSNLKPT